MQTPDCNPEPLNPWGGAPKLPPVPLALDGVLGIDGTITPPVASPRTSTIAAAVAEVLDKKGSAAELIAALKQHPRLAFLYETQPRFPGQYRLDDHTHAVIRQFDKYFAESAPPPGIRPQLIRLTLALHDIGKYIPDTTAEQHEATVGVLQGVRHDLPVSDEEFSLMVALIDGDPIGKASIRLTDHTRLNRCAIPVTIEDLREYSRTSTPPIPDAAAVDREVRRVTEEIKDMSSKTHLSQADFTKLLVWYYQCDSSAYSVDGELFDGRRAHAALEFLYELGQSLPEKTGDALFVTDAALGMLRPSPPFLPLFASILRCASDWTDSDRADSVKGVTSP